MGEIFSRDESLNRIYRILKGQTGSAGRDDLLGELLAWNEALSRIARLLEGNQPGESASVPSVFGLNNLKIHPVDGANWGVLVLNEVGLTTTSYADLDLTAGDSQMPATAKAALLYVIFADGENVSGNHGTLSFRPSSTLTNPALQLRWLYPVDQDVDTFLIKVVDGKIQWSVTQEQTNQWFTLGYLLGWLE